MNRRVFLVSLAGGLLAAPLAAEAQEYKARKVYRVAYLSNSTERTPVDAAFLDALRELGYIEGQNVRIDARYTGGRHDQFPGIVTDVVSQYPDVIFVWSGAFAKAVKNATTSIPIVFAVIGPVENGLVESMARPGGNATGFTIFGYDLVAKQLSLLRELVPNANRVGLLVNTANVVTPFYTAPAVKVGPSLNLTVELVKANAPDQIDGAFAEMRERQIPAVLVTGDPMYWSIRERIVQVAAQARLPAMYWTREYVQAGGLISYSASLQEIGRQGAMYVARILKGARPMDMPVQDPTKYELVINLKTAQTLGLTIPPSLLVRADQVLE